MTNDQSCAVFSPGGVRQVPQEQRRPESLVRSYLFFDGDGVSASPRRCSDRQAGKRVGEGVQKPLASSETITTATPLCKRCTAVRGRRVKYFWLNSITGGCKRSLLEACSGF